MIRVHRGRLAAVARGTCVWLLCSWCGLGAEDASAAVYHVDARQGDDARDGLAPGAAWRTLDRVHRAELQAGDRVLFRAGGAWSGQLRVERSGAPDRPIAYGAYGEGSRPRIDAGGQFEDALLIRNAQHVEVRGLDLTNLGEGDRPRRGVNVVADNLFVSEGIARYGHQTGRSDDGSYALGAGWGPAKRVAFHGNRYVGRHEDRPEEAEEPSRAPSPMAFDDWPGPRFDPAHPEDFGAFVGRHREWMLRLMERQFGRRPALWREDPPPQKSESEG